MTYSLDTEQSTISIPRTLANRLLTLAQLSPDDEICGLIAIQADSKYHVYPIDNIATDKSCRFEMQPRQQIDAFKTIREKQEELFAVFHSHPHSAAIPSNKDIKEAAYDSALNIIISLSTRGVLDMRGYFYHNDKVKVVELIIS